jgi:aspartyl-tRNA(Asn)/glutamyl-tRNA(Gln) amidotransferase subunit B
LAVNGKIALHPRENGRLFDQPFVVPIDRVQLEQDTAQSIESIFKYESYRRSLINYNRSSAPLIEIITPPVLPTPTLAGAAFTKIIELLQVTETSTADLHLGAMRCDANVSLGLNSPRVEIKNLNGSRAVREACTAELQCQVQLYKQKKAIISSTKRWTGKNLEVMRTKAVDKDYRYDLDTTGLMLDICLTPIYRLLYWMTNLLRRRGLPFHYYRIT